MLIETCKLIVYLIKTMKKLILHLLVLISSSLTGWFQARKPGIRQDGIQGSQTGFLDGKICGERSDKDFLFFRSHPGEYR